MEYTKEDIEYLEELCADNEIIKMKIRINDYLTYKYASNKYYSFDMYIYDFMIRVYNLKPQRYGFRVQAYFSLLMGYKLIPSSLDSGDFENKYGELVEFKCSFLGLNSNVINVRQVRLWQDIHYYYIFEVDFTDLDKIKYKTFKLTKQEMIEECEILGNPCHMTALKNGENKNVELGFEINRNSKHYTRWLEKYYLKNYDIEKLSHNFVDKLTNDKIKDDLLSEYVNILNK